MTIWARVTHRTQPHVPSMATGMTEGVHAIPRMPHKPSDPKGHHGLLGKRVEGNLPDSNSEKSNFLGKRTFSNKVNRNIRTSFKKRDIWVPPEATGLQVGQRTGDFRRPSKPWHVSDRLLFMKQRWLHFITSHTPLGLRSYNTNRPATQEGQTGERYECGVEQEVRGCRLTLRLKPPSAPEVQNQNDKTRPCRLMNQWYLTTNPETCRPQIICLISRLKITTQIHGDLCTCALFGNVFQEGSQSKLCT